MAQQPLNSDTQAQDKRAAARRARRLALTLLAEDDRARLTQFADEMDMEAAALEQSTGTFLLQPAVAPHLQVQYQQVQPQQSAGTPSLIEVPKEQD